MKKPKELKTFRLGCTVQVVAYTDIEAESLEDAIQAAYDRSVWMATGRLEGSNIASEWVCDHVASNADDIFES